SKKSEPLIGSHAVEFVREGKKLQGKNKPLLNLTLALLDVADRHAGNVGISHDLAFAVDLDQTKKFSSNWLLDLTFSYLSGDLEKKAIEQIIQIPDEDIIQVFAMAVSELREAFLLKPLNTYLNKLFNVDSVINNIILRKQQFKWVFENYTYVLRILNESDSVPLNDVINLINKEN